MNIFKKKPNVLVKIFDDAESEIGAASGSTPQGVIGLTSETEYLPRRKKKKGEYINFYDLGEFLHTDGETWIDDVRQVIPSVALLNANYATSETALNEFIAPAAVAAQYNKPLEIPLANWQTRFRKVSYEDAFKYRLQVYIGREGYDLINTDNENWTEQGLKIPKDDELFEGAELKFYDLDVAEQKPDKAVFYDKMHGAGNHNGIFRPLRHNDSDIKVTASPNYNAPALDIDGISLAGGQSVDVFINRALLEMQVRRNSGDNRQYLNVFYSALPKSVFFNDDLRIERNYDELAFRIDWRRAMQEIPNARQLLFNNISETFSVQGLQTDWGSSDYIYSNFKIEDAFHGGEWYLSGAVKKSSNWFFYWEKPE